MSGTAKLLVSSKVAKALGLKSTTLATAKVSLHERRQQVREVQGQQQGQEGPGQGQGLRQGHALREPEGQGEATKNSTRAVTLTRK